MILRLLRKVLPVLAALWAAATVAGTCKLTGSVCSDSTPCRSITGVMTCLAGQPGGQVNLAASCWQYTDSYDCETADAKDWCAPLKGLSGCGVTNSVCNATDFNSKCLNYTNTYNCKNAALNDAALPANVTLTSGPTYVIASETIDDSGCGAMKTSASCVQVGSDVCTDPGPTKTINGDVLTRPCWAWERTYNCVGPTTTSECSTYAADPNCTLTNTECTDYLPASEGGACSITTKTYRCSTGGGGPTVVNDCATQKYCEGPACFDMSSIADTAFGSTVAGLEVMREIGYYLNPGTLTVFAGSTSSCEDKLFGLGDCCKTSGGGGGMSNASIVSAAGGKALQFGYQYARAIGTPYVYDMMFNSSFPALVDLAVDAWSASAWSYSGNVGVFGFEFSVSTAGIEFVGFDPYSLAFDVGMMILSSMLSCSQDEQMLALKRGQNLCVFQKSECTEKLPIFGTCITTTNTYCCYNSILAKIVATGANAQLGRGLSCAGFTPDDLAKVNFAAINFSEFIASVAPRARGSLPSVNYAKDKINSYYGK